MEVPIKGGVNQNIVCMCLRNYLFIETAMILQNAPLWGYALSFIGNPTSV